LRERWVRRRKRGGEEGKYLESPERYISEKATTLGEGWIRVGGLRL